MANLKDVVISDLKPGEIQDSSILKVKIKKSAWLNSKTAILLVEDSKGDVMSLTLFNHIHSSDISHSHDGCFGIEEGVEIGIKQPHVNVSYEGHL